MNRYYKTILRDSEKRADIVFKFQVMDRNSFDYGGVQVEERYVEVKPTIYKIATSIAVYLHEGSKYYKNKLLLERIRLGLDYVRRMQREDGTFDLLSCNFYSAPDTAFCIKRLIHSYRILEKYGFDESCLELKNRILDIIRDAAYGMAEGGFHTPNHRWAIASILMACYGILEDKMLKEKAEAYLIEGIDCNEDGEYSERSAAIYNVVNNAAMITLYEETGNEEYISYVRRNLEMMLTYFEPDGSIFTGNSTRQDRGKKVFPRDYFYQYLYLAEKYGDKTFEAAAHKIIHDHIQRGERKAPDCLDLLMLHEKLASYSLKEYGFPEEYHKNYASSGIVRVKRGDISYSIVRDSTSFLFFQTGSLQIYMKIGVSYFDQRNFKIQNMKKENDSYILDYTARGWYYLPFSEAPDTSDWWKMRNEDREKIYKKDLNISVIVTEKQNGLDVRIKTGGCDRVPVRIEVGVPAGSIIDSRYFYCNARAGEALLVRDGLIKITEGMDRIVIGPGFGTHQFIEGKTGSEARSEDGFTLYFTDFTNFDHTITIEKGF